MPTNYVPDIVCYDPSTDSLCIVEDTVGALFIRSMTNKVKQTDHAFNALRTQFKSLERRVLIVGANNLDYEKKLFTEMSLKQIETN